MATKKGTHNGKRLSGEPVPACGLCGQTKNLTKTECCGNWICDDEHKYVMFSYARNSCHRNHRRYTLCGFHHVEGHEGRWQDCPKCRESLETEMYVWYGTNDYNFETLRNPPAYEPTTCHKCGRRISLGEDGYSSIGGHYFCDNCTAERMGGTLSLSDGIPTAPPKGQPGAQQEEAMSLRVVRGEDADEDLDETAEEVPPAYRRRFEDILALTDRFCDEHLNDEYKEFSHEMAAAVCQEGSPARKGKAEGWAAGIVYSLGRVNFLDDPSQTPHMKSAQIAEVFGVSVGTMQAKAKVIREGLDLMPFHPEWTLPSRMADNPLIWMFEVNGAVVDIRMAPRDAQVAAYKRGLIPYIPADRRE